VLILIFIYYYNHGIENNVHFQWQQQQQQQAVESLIVKKSNPICKNNTSSITMKSQICYLSATSSNNGSGGRCHSPPETTPRYLIPQQNSNNNNNNKLSSYDLEHNVLFIFIHINKCGGTTIKRQVIERALTQQKWDGASFGTARGFRRLGKPWTNNSTTNKRKNTRFWGGPNWFPLPPNQDKMPEFFKCGIGVHNNINNNDPFLPTTTTPNHSTSSSSTCPLRFVWGSESIGLCEHFPQIPCLYFTILRDPIQRAISFYNYFCINGEEHRKMWEPEWIQQGICPLTLPEFVAKSGTTFLERLNRKPKDRSSCGVNISSQNLLHPCFRYLLLDHFQHGIEQLSKTFGLSLQPYFIKLLQNYDSNKENQEQYSPRTLDQINNEQIMNELKLLLKYDIDLYQIALENYNQQWEKELVPCPLP
jgi:hypothetical protein